MNKALLQTENTFLRNKIKHLEKQIQILIGREITNGIVDAKGKVVGNDVSEIYGD